MQLTARQLLAQHAHVLQNELFPCLAASLGELSPQVELLAAITALVPIHKFMPTRRRTGRPPKDRVGLATAFLAKAVLNLPTTRDLIDRLRVDEALRRFCGWTRVAALPHESKFSRAFAEFAATALPQQLHAAVVEATQRTRLVGHIARDSTAIAARERFADPPSPLRVARPSPAKKNKKKGSRKSSGPRRKHLFARAKARERGKRITRQRHQSVAQMLADLPQACDIGVKKNSAGHQYYWRGFKLHLDVADGQIPITAILTSASVHDSQVAIPLMTITSSRVVHLYELMDSAYDADQILAHSRQLNHVPIAAIHPRRGTKKPSPLTKVFPAKATPTLDWAKQERYKERTMSERVNARLKDEFGASQIRVRGAAKVMTHLMFGVLALTVDQWLKLTG